MEFPGEKNPSWKVLAWEMRKSPSLRGWFGVMKSMEKHGCVRRNTSKERSWVFAESIFSSEITNVSLMAI